MSVVEQAPAAAGVSPRTRAGGRCRRWCWASRSSATASSDHTAENHPTSLVTYFTTACNLLRHDAQLDKVRPLCTPYLGKWP